MTEEGRLRLTIDIILRDRHIGFYRLCGKEVQKHYRHANLTKNAPDRAALLKEIIEVYDKTLDNKPYMTEKERTAKKERIRIYAVKKWEVRKNGKVNLHALESK